MVKSGKAGETEMWKNTVICGRQEEEAAAEYLEYIPFMQG